MSISFLFVKNKGVFELRYDNIISSAPILFNESNRYLPFIYISSLKFFQRVSLITLFIEIFLSLYEILKLLSSFDNLIMYLSDLILNIVFNSWINIFLLII